MAKGQADLTECQEQKLRKHPFLPQMRNPFCECPGSQRPDVGASWELGLVQECLLSALTPMAFCDIFKDLHQEKRWKLPF